MAERYVPSAPTTRIPRRDRRISRVILDASFSGLGERRDHIENALALAAIIREHDTRYRRTLFIAHLGNFHEKFLCSARGADENSFRQRSWSRPSTQRRMFTPECPRRCSSLEFPRGLDRTATKNRSPARTVYRTTLWPPYAIEADLRPIVSIVVPIATGTARVWFTAIPARRLTFLPDSSFLSFGCRCRPPR